MRNRWLSAVLCLLVAVGLIASMGCNAFTAERNRRRAYVARSDADRIADDVDWLLGLDEPSILYEESFTPY
ncbi:MAG: hypothetical protein ACOC7T_02140 [Planctomycetota bacterium]